MLIRSRRYWALNEGSNEHVKDRYYSSLEENVLPSQKTEYAWLQCWVDEEEEEEQEEAEPIEEMLVGKWMIFCKSMTEADELWPILKKALYGHELGPTMKSATELSRNGVLICIYTDDWYDIADLRRVLQTIRKLGRQEKIFYKADAQTALGISGSIYVSPHDTLIEVTKKGYEWYEFMNRSIPEM